MGVEGFGAKNYTRLFFNVRSQRMLDRKPVIDLFKYQSLRSVVFKLWQAKEVDISFRSLDVLDKFKLF